MSRKILFDYSATANKNQSQALMGSSAIQIQTNLNLLLLNSDWEEDFRLKDQKEYSDSCNTLLNLHLH